MAKPHSERVHALCSASGAERWMNCPGSVAMCEANPAGEESIYAKEGTTAHELSEKILRPIVEHYNKNRNIGEVSRDDIREKLVDEEGYDPEMFDHCFDYANLILDQIEEYNPKKVCLEERVSLSAEYEMFGTADCFMAFRSKGKAVLSVWDLKYGKGKVVEVTSPQLKYYACAVQRTYEKILFDEIWLNVFQPRADHADGPHRTGTMTKDDVLEWFGRFCLGAKQALQELRAKDLTALTLKAGDHCGFCDARASCPAYAKNIQDRAGLDFMDDPSLLTPAIPEQRKELMTTFDAERVSRLLTVAPEVTKYFTNLKEVAINYLQGGGEIPGWKLVQARSTRRFKKETKEVAAGLKKLGITDPYDKSIKGIGAIVKELKATGMKEKEADAAIEPFITRPPGGISIAPEDDDRPQIKAGDKARNDFDVIEVDAISVT